MRQKADGWPA